MYDLNNFHRCRDSFIQFSDFGVVGYDAVEGCKRLPAFWENITAPSSGYK
jgi:hypothetical protein